MSASQAADAHQEVTEQTIEATVSGNKTEATAESGTMPVSQKSSTSNYPWLNVTKFCQAQLDHFF